MTTAGEALGEEAARKLMDHGDEFTMGPGLDDAELGAVEREHGFTFADDHRAFLRRLLPTGPRWPDWRSPGDPALARRLAWPVEGVLFDVEENGVWFEDRWGARPGTAAAALAEAERRLSAVPRMIPVHGHRYLPAGTGTSGHPVLSMYQTDIIYYGADLADYIDVEFARAGRRIPDDPERTVSFWRDLVG